MFEPGFFGLFINPFYFARKGLYTAIKHLSIHIEGKILDVGCGQKPYQHLFKSASDYVGLEIDTQQNRLYKKADFFYDGKTFPFGAQEFDSVIASQVLEHVFEPEQFLKEISRVLKPGGTLFLTVPFVWDEHEQPFDYARYSSFGLKYLLEKSGFEIVTHVKTATNISIIFQLVNAYLYKTVLHTDNRYLNLMLTIFLISPFNILGTLLAEILPKNNDLYLDNIVLARKIH